MKIGIGILNVMAAVWAVLALLSAHLAPWTYAAAVIIALIPLLLMKTRHFPPRSKEEGRRIGRLVGTASFVEGLAIFAGIQLLVHIGQDDFVICLIAAIVGLHFIPLARWMPRPVYYVPAFALLAAAAIGLRLPSEYRDTFVAAAASLALWGTALAAVLRMPPLAARAE